MSHANERRLPGSPGCIVCDNNGSNARSLHLRLWYDPEARIVRIPCEPDASWCGYDQVVHGGLVATVMDEAMAWVVKEVTGDWAFTAQCSIRYKKPVRPGFACRCEARVLTVEKRKILAEALFMDEAGAVLARAEATFLPAKGQARPRV